jgi:RNA polymerase sigma-70 factor (ECF subfamily)
MSQSVCNATDQVVRDAEADRQLLARIAARDARAMKELYVRYCRRVGAFLTRITRRGELVDEMINDTFMVVWTQAHAFRDEAQVSTWIFGIAYRRGLTSVRHETRAQAHKQMPTRHGDEVDDAPERADQIEWLVHALDQLPFEQRAALQLTYWLGLSCEETAAVMQCPTNTVKTRMLYARRKLRVLLPTLDGSVKTGGATLMTPSAISPDPTKT